MYQLTDKQKADAISTSAYSLYALADNPVFLGQTPVDSKGFFKMYWQVEETIYVTTSNLLG